MPEYTNTELKAALQQLLVEDDDVKTKVRALLTTKKPTAAAAFGASLQPVHYAINKWGYSALFGMWGLAFGSEPGGFSGLQGFLIGAVGTFIALSLLELAGRLLRSQN